MATDIAFCIGLLTLLGDRVPRPLVVFVTALAIFDDIGGILVIAFFYGGALDLAWLGGAAAITFLVLVVNRLQVSAPPPSPVPSARRCARWPSISARCSS